MNETSRLRQYTIAYLVGVFLWAVAGFWVVPRVLVNQRSTEGLPAVAHWVQQLGVQTPNQVERVWRKLHWASLVVLLAPPLFLAGPRRLGQSLFDRFVGEATPEVLGGLRCWVFLILAFHVFSQDLPGIALLPPQLRRPMGVMSVFHSLPGWDAMYTNARALTGLKLLTLATMSAAMLGWKTRWSVPCAALLGLICGGILREYSHFFHQYLVPMQLAVLLSFLPCGDGFSVDQFLRRKRGEGEPPRSPAVYGWSRYACWILIAGSYVSAGLSKLRNGGLLWWNGLNLKNIILTHTLEPKQHEWGLEQFLTGLPLEFFAVLGLAGLMTELLYGLVLLSRRARLVMPILAVGLHVGIMIFQGILFLDLILIQAIFLFDFWTGSSTRVGEMVPENQDWDGSTAAAPHRHGFRFCLGCLMFVLFCWILLLERYPATAWQMFSNTRKSDLIRWHKIFAVFADGHREEANPEEWIGALAVTRYSEFLRRDTAEKEVFFEAALSQMNLSRPQNPIVSLEVVDYTWHFLSPAADPQLGTIDHVWKYPVTPPTDD